MGLPMEDLASGSGRRSFLPWQPPGPKLPPSTMLCCAWEPQP